MKILLLGAGGQLGWELQRTLAPLGQVHAPARHSAELAVDLAQPDTLRAAVRALRPGVIVNAAAYTAVDRAEEEPDVAMAVNGAAPGVLAEEARRCGAGLVHYSTDYVFDGGARRPYTETDVPAPACVYGSTKLEGERAVRAVGGAYWILRTAWVYGGRGHNFLRTMLRLGAERDELRVVDDQHGSPTWSRLVAEATAQMLARCAVLGAGTAALVERAGVYHLTCNGETTWYGFARAIFERAAARRRPELRAIPTRAYPTPAHRPPYSVLDNTRLREAFGLILPPWEQGLALCLAEMGSGGT